MSVTINAPSNVTVSENNLTSLFRATAKITQSEGSFTKLTGWQLDTESNESREFFSIESNTFFTRDSPVIKLRQALDYENPQDFNGDNVYAVTITAHYETESFSVGVQSGGGSFTGSVSKTIFVTVTDVDEAPVLTSASTASFAENGTGIAYQGSGTDPEGFGLSSWGLSGADAARFDIDETGAVRFISAPDHEAPTDRNGDGIYEFTVTASDGGQTASKAVRLTVTDVNERPVITSGTTASVAEGATGIVYQTVVVDPEGASPTWSIFGIDAALFRIDANGGLSFRSPPDFEAPLDQGANNVYDLTIRAQFFETAPNGTVTITNVQTPVSITVGNVDDRAPVITSGDSGGIEENTAGVAYQATAIDLDGSATIGWSLAGLDESSFVIDSTGAVRFAAPPDYEAPADSDGDGIYQITVLASDGTNIGSQDVSIAVGNVNDNAPQIVSGTTADFAENGTGVAYQAQAVDEDGQESFIWTLGGVDAGFFSIDAEGSVRFIDPPDYETPLDGNFNNVYLFTVNASDGDLTTSQTVRITVTNESDLPPGVITGLVPPYAENSFGPVLQATAFDPDSTGEVYWALSGPDAAQFAIDSTGTVYFVRPPDFEAPTDSNGDNLYVFEVNVSDGFGSSFSLVLVPVEDRLDPPLAPISPVTLTAIEEDATGLITEAALLEGWIDQDSTTLHVVDLTVSSGTLTDNGNGTWTFQGDPDDDTDVTFTYGVTDGTFVNPVGEAILDLLPTNAGATGSVGFRLEEGTLLATATVADPEGILSEGFQWQVFVDGAWQDIPGATDAAYTPAAEASEQLLRVVYRFIDGGGDAGEFSATEVAVAGTGADEDILAAPGTLAVLGLDGADTLTADDAGGTLGGGAGNDRLEGSDGADLLEGGAGDDVLIGGEGADTLAGGAGNDLLVGDVGGADWVDFSAASAPVTVFVDGAATGEGSDRLFDIAGVLGSAFDDSLSGDAAANTLAGEDGEDTIQGAAGADLLEGGAGNDSALGGQDSDTLLGGDGADTLAGGQGTDSLDGGGDAGDLLSFAGSGSGVTVDLSSSVASNSQGTDTVTGFTDVVGGNSADALTGNAEANALLGGGGGDTLAGAGGDDTLTGGAGDDVLFGGDGDDIAIFAGARADYAVEQGEDTLGGYQLVTGPDGTDRIYGAEILRFADEDVPVCFLPGALIMTPSGEVPVEGLRPGDLVLTADGKVAPVRWLARQTIAARFADPLQVNPIRICAGALAEGVPSRDLWVSPAHALLVGGVLVQAGALANGISVVREAPPAAVFAYYHVELDAHRLLLANGTPAESFVDTVERGRFDNAMERADAPSVEEMPLARARSHRQVPHAVRKLLAARAAMAPRQREGVRAA